MPANSTASKFIRKPVKPYDPELTVSRLELRSINTHFAHATEPFSVDKSLKRAYYYS
jgi:hypothetical protein